MKNPIQHPDQVHIGNFAEKTMSTCQQKQEIDNIKR